MFRTYSPSDNRGGRGRGNFESGDIRRKEVVSGFGNADTDGAWGRGDSSFRNEQQQVPNWKRSGTSDQEESGSWGRSADSFPRQSAPSGRDSTGWEKGGRQDRGGFDDFPSSRQGRTFNDERGSSARPEHMKLNLKPRQSDGGVVPSAAIESASKPADTDPEDKWAKVFSKSSVKHDNRQVSGLNNSMASLKVTAPPVKPQVVAPKEVAKPEPAAGPSKKELREEAERLAREERAAASLRARQLAEEAIIVKAKLVALSDELLVGGLKGSALTEHIEASSANITASALVTSVLNKIDVVNLNLKWLSNDEFGHAVKHLTHQSREEQVATLFAIQDFCYRHKFPKIDVKGKQRSYIDVVFQQLFAVEIADEGSFLAWADADSDAPGRTDAIVQTTAFVNLLRESDDNFSEGEDEDLYIDAPREVVK